MIPRRLPVAEGYVVFAIVYYIFGSAPGKTAIWAAMAFYGLYYAMTTPSAEGHCGRCSSERCERKSAGNLYFVSSVMALSASVATGELWKHFGPRVPFYLSAGLAALAAVLLTAGVRSQRTCISMRRSIRRPSGARLRIRTFRSSRGGTSYSSAVAGFILFQFHAGQVARMPTRYRHTVPLALKQAALRKVLNFHGKDSGLHYADHVNGSGVALFDRVCEMDLEGIVAKHATAPYL